MVHSVLLVALTVGLFGVLPRLAGLSRDAEALRHAKPALVTAAIVAQAASLAAYALLFRRVRGPAGLLRSGRRRRV